MSRVTLEQIHEDLEELKTDVKNMKALIQEDFELADDVVKEVVESRKRPKESFISNEEMGREFG